MGSRVLVYALSSLLTACGARTSLELELAAAGAPAVPQQMTPAEPSDLACGHTGRCVSTTKTFQGDLGGLAGADKLCQAEYPGSHFFRRDCDALRDLSHAMGYGELLLGACWNCNGWTAASSGNYQPDQVECQSGYATVGGVLPYSACSDLEHFGSCWRICEGGNEPLVCCLP